MSCKTLRIGLPLLVMLAGPAVPATSADLPSHPGLLDLSRFEFQAPPLPAVGAEAFETVVVVNGLAHEVALRRHSVRAPGFRVVLAGENGAIEEIVPPPPATYRGTVVGAPGSLVAASLVDGQLTAFAVMPDGRGWSIQPADTLVPGAPADLHVAYDHADVRPDATTCGTDADGGGAPARRPIDPDADETDGGAGAPAGEKIAQLAFDADFEFYQQNGSSSARTVYDIEQVTNAMNVIYRRDVAIDHFITFLIVRISEPDPYTETDSLLLICELRRHWNQNWSWVPRDITHLMTGRNLDGSIIGRAHIGTICNVVREGPACAPETSNMGYGLSQSTSTVFARRVALTAHELGHSWDARHCNGDGDCAIMCSNLGGCTGNIDRFGNRAVNAINNFESSRNCLITCDPFVRVPDETSSIYDAVYRVCWDGVVSIQAGTYLNHITRVSKAVELRAVGGFFT